MATVRAISSAAKLINLNNALLPVGIKFSPMFIKQTVAQTYVPVRWATYRRGARMDSREVLTEVEVVNDPAAWAVVEDLVAQHTIPIPTPKDEYPSGWKPPKLDKNLPYYVARTANHMHSVHMSFNRLSTRRITVLRRIQGDIWQLEKDLRAYLERVEKNPYICSSVNEAYAKIYFRGDHENNIKVWLEKQGF